MTAERNREGAWVLSDIIGGYLVSKAYYGYTKREATTLFRAYCKEKTAGVFI